MTAQDKDARRKVRDAVRAAVSDDPISISEMVSALQPDFTERESREAMMHLVQTGELRLTFDFKLLRQVDRSLVATGALPARESALWGLLADALAQRQRVRIEKAKDGRGVTLRVGHRSVNRDTLEVAVRAAYDGSFDD